MKNTIKHHNTFPNPPHPTQHAFHIIIIIIPPRTNSWKDEDAREVWLVRVQDTPGYGDDTNIQTHVDMVRGGGSGAACG